MKLRIQQPTDTSNAFRLFQQTLEQQRLKVQFNHAESAVATCGFSTKKTKDLLKLAAPISLTTRNKALELEAAFINTKRTYVFLIAFPLALAVVIAVILGVVFSRNEQLQSVLIPAIVFPILLNVGIAFSGVSIVAYRQQRARAVIEDLATQLAAASGGTVSEPARDRQDTPSFAPLAVTTALFIVSLLIAFLVIPGGLGNMLDTSNRVMLPTEQVIHLSGPGTYTVFYEFRANVDGHQYATLKSWRPSSAELRATDSNETIAIDLIPPMTNYTLPSRSGLSVARFTANQAGAYTLSMGGIPEGETRLVTVTRFDTSEVLWTIGRWFLVISMTIAWVFNLLRFFNLGRKATIVPR